MSGKAILVGGPFNGRRMTHTGRDVIIAEQRSSHRIRTMEYEHTGRTSDGIEVYEFVEESLVETKRGER